LLGHKSRMYSLHNNKYIIYIYIFTGVRDTSIEGSCDVDVEHLHYRYQHLYRGAIENVNRFVGDKRDPPAPPYTHTHTHTHTLCVYLWRYNILLSKDFYDHCRRPKGKGRASHLYTCTTAQKSFYFFSDYCLDLLKFRRSNT